MASLIKVFATDGFFLAEAKSALELQLQICPCIYMYIAKCNFWSIHVILINVLYHYLFEFSKEIAKGKKNNIM